MQFLTKMSAVLNGAKNCILCWRGWKPEISVDVNLQNVSYICPFSSIRVWFWAANENFPFAKTIYMFEYVVQHFWKKNIFHKFACVETNYHKSHPCQNLGLKERNMWGAKRIDVQTHDRCSWWETYTRCIYL